MPKPSQPQPGPLDPTDHLPLTLLKSDTVPPAPNRSASTIDWLPDFSGHSWVAYGASSLLVISHLPSPLSRQEFLIAPILRQVFELSGHHSSPVTAVSWSPATPSVGELAAASGNCVFFFSPDSTSSIGSFCWSHNGVLVQSTEVEAMRWSGSGDGIILGGVDVVLWKRKTNRTWEIAWKFKTDVPQNLVSATWSIEGPSASTAKCGSDVGVSECNSNNANKSVMVYYGCGSNEYAKVELCHPCPVSMIQWRPLSGPGSWCGLLDLPRQVLLTCCLDGTVRLWSEVDNGKVRKLGKEIGDHKGMRRTFCVAAVIEINQVLRGRLGVDVFLSWATDIGGVYKIGDGATHFFSAEGHWHDKVGRCEWLIGFGPGTSVSFWAVHCLDDVSSARFPRVTLWKRQELQGFDEGAAVSDSKDSLLLNKVVTLRNSVAGPPVICSLIHLLPSNSLGWSLMYNQTSSSVEDGQIESKIDVYSVTTAGGFPVGGHTGNILQVVMHPCPYEAELAASLDSNGLLLFWLVSAISNRNLGLEVLAPAWEVCGKIATHDIGTKYTSVRWAPSVLGEDFVILLGHVGGIDCFIVNTSQVGEEGIVCSYVCTVPLGNYGPFSDGPTNIFAIPLPSTCHHTFLYNKFLLLGIWMRDFCALSWEVTLHSGNLPGSCSECGFDGKNSTSCFVWKFENTIGNKRYSLGVNPCSSQLPQPYSHDQVTCYSVVCPRNLLPAQESLGSHKVGIPAYIMATGCSDGTLKLWRSISSELSAPYIPWELVGEVAVNEGPVSALSLTDSGQRIATVSTGSHVDGISIIHIWDTVHLAGGGTFVSEDTLTIDGEIVALSWLALGNGENVLGVCVKNELQVYVRKRCAGHPLLNPGKSLNLPHWSCIAVAPTFHAIRGFLWGTGTNAVIVHDCHFSLYGQLLLLDKKQHVKIQPNFKRGHCEDDKDTDIPFSVFTGIDNELGYLEELLGVISRSNKHESPKNTRVKNECFSSSLLVAGTKLNDCSCTLLGSWNLVDITEKLTGMLPVYHPEVLLMNISTGNWKRANVAVRHLTEFLSSSNGNGSEKRHDSATHVHFFPQIPLASYMEGLQLKNSVDKGFEWGVYAQLPSSSQFVPYNARCDASSDGFSLSSAKSGVSSLMVTLEQSNNLAACATDKLQMLAVVDLLGEVQHSSSAYGNLDEPGRRFWVALRFQQLHYFQRFGRSPSVEELVVDSQLFSWAFHSDCQDTLLSSFLPNEPSWKEMRTLGVGFWFTNGAQLRARMERLARYQYLRKKDPKDCTLLYIALNRLQVLAGLFKISKDEKDKPLVGFLSRNFQEEKNKAAALKNAYVLMGRHQLELAIAFFLLGGDTSSAITICAKNLGDEQLALVICRLVESSGGPLGCHLITKFILPSASERSDYWLASLLEWELGNYSQSFVRMLGFEASSVVGKPVPSVNHVAFTDPCIGLYCLVLANKNSMKNAIGEQNAAILSRWANFMIVKSFSRCGLPLEALEFFSSSLSIVGPMSQGTLADVDHLGVLNLLLKPSSNESLNWLLGDVALHLEFQAKLDLTLQYFSNLMKEHPGWLTMTVGSVQPGTYSKTCEDYEGLRATFHEKLNVGLSKIEQKFSVDTFCIVEMILVWLCSNGLPFVGYDVLLDYNARNNLREKSHSAADFCRLHKPLLKAAGDFSLLLSRFIVSCSFSWFRPKSCHLKNDQSIVVKSIESCALYFQGIMQMLCTLRVAIREIFWDFLEDSIRRPLVLLDLFEYSAHFALYWFQQNSDSLLLMLQPLLTTCTDGNLLYEVDMAKLKNSLYHIEEMLSYHLPTSDSGIGHEITTFSPHKQEVDLMQSSSQDERWHVIGACLWHHMSSLADHKLHGLSIELEDSWISGVSHGVVPFWRSSLTNLVLDASNLTEIELLSLILSSFLKTTLSYLSSYHVKLLVSFLHQKIEDRLHVQTLVWLKDSSVSQDRVPCPDVKDIVIGGNELSTFDALWDSCADPCVISRAFEREKIEWSHVINHRFSKAWTDVYKDIAGEDDPEEMLNHQVNLSSGPSTDEAVSPPKGFFRNGRTLLSYWQKDAVIVKEVSDFQCPNEIYKSDGDLFEVMCVNSVSECQAAVASNRKGIIFFSWEDEVSFGHPSDYIWSDADWPPNGWAGSASTPIPTCVSPGVGLGSRKGSHLGLGGATIGMGSLARPRKDSMGGGAFGVPGYTVVGASGLGWEVQEDFEEFVDTPATVENIRTRAFSSHPSRPFFLVGSSNTHIYLWEFGKDKATATYGVLPAANVPPPYALASVSAVQFDNFGHRFATAAVDGTVCTWQLEVGGRSNIRPTESSLCFNGHASDVTYVTSSGSIIATAGYSSNGANVVVWDTLAPPTTSRASIICHEGGARSISVLENVIGSGSVSPLIVTGGKGGDVGIHDFRYIATGRIKKHRRHNNSDISGNSSSKNDTSVVNNNMADQNLNGMLWYIPKAHLGSVTKISTIPNTSLFLTGSKDGDVKLWDAKAAKLVHHWPKLHERRTFLQPNSRGFGGVVRAAVTDIQVVSRGFLTCGGDGTVKLVQLKGYQHGT